MFRCLDCGHIFEDGEQKVYANNHYEIDAHCIEYISGCPICGGSYEEAKNCEKCYEVTPEEELFSGLCADCLREEIDYDTALEYFVHWNMVVDFMVGKWYGTDFDGDASPKFTEAMKEAFKRAKYDDLLIGKTDFIKAIKEYILDDDGDFGKEEFAEWLSNRK